MWPMCVLVQVLERLMEERRWFLPARRQGMEDFIMNFALEFGDGDVFFLLFQGGVDDACPN